MKNIPHLNEHVRGINERITEGLYFGLSAIAFKAVSGWAAANDYNVLSNVLTVPVVFGAIASTIMFGVAYSDISVLKTKLVNSNRQPHP